MIVKVKTETSGLSDCDDVSECMIKSFNKCFKFLLSRSLQAIGFQNVYYSDFAFKCKSLFL